MHEHGKSDSLIVPRKRPNEGTGTAQEPEEVVEGRGLAKGNSLEQNAPRTQSRISALSAFERVREAARFDARTQGRSPVR